MSTGLMWFRRDLRLRDNTALHHALAACEKVYCVFCFDREILDRIEDKSDRRVDFIHQCVSELDTELSKLGSSLIVRYARASEDIPTLARTLNADRVYANHDYEPRRISRDQAVGMALQRDGRELLTYKDHVVFERNEIINQSGLPFRVYTPYKKAWRSALRDEHIAERDCSLKNGKFAKPLPAWSHAWTLGDLGFSKSDLTVAGGMCAARAMFEEFLQRIDHYRDLRDFPAADGVSRLSVHLRFGTISIRELVREAIKRSSAGAATWVDELIWREFYNMILHFFPHTQSHAFQTDLDDLPWRRDREQFGAWCEGRTGYPIVDAAMRELNATGYMHNRARMIVASFLTKDLLIDWCWGERYFARKLLDYDLSQNLGGWQWSASIGTDAQPYFRVFNPVLQSERFDPAGVYIRRFVPELRHYPNHAIHEPWKTPPISQAQFKCVIGRDYPEPIVDHDESRRAAVEMFRVARSRST
ncbi:MAG: deoxyribodipyrimidine photo-lyase [Phycisphaerae bacterium]|nr:deoxyribodipyrimidine photo-lyase [Phycisphaerae bacterium]